MLAVLLYALTLGGTYIYDDVQIVRDDPRLRDAHQWRQLWTSPYFADSPDNLYRPLTSSTYAIEWVLHGNRPWIFHGINVLLHALTAAGVAELTRRVLRRTSIAQSAAFCAGLLFAAHPGHVEAVANIVGRAELLAAACILWGLILFCKRPLTLPRVLAMLTLGIAGLLCKEQGILAPLLWLIFGLILRQGAVQSAKEKSAVKTLLLLTTWTWAAYLIGREHFLKFEWDRSLIDPIIQPMVLSHGLDRLLMPVALLGRYAMLMLWPAHLSLDYSGNVIGSAVHFSDPYLWVGTIAIAAWLIGVAICLRSKKPMQKVLLFCLFSAAVTCGMIGNVVSLIGTIFAERLLYLPSTFFLMVAGILLALLPRRSRAIVLGAALILASIRTVTAVADWNHPLVLYQHDLAHEPKSFQLRLLLSQEYHARGDLPAARRELDELCRQYPDYYRSWMYRAIEEMDDGDLTAADASLKRAIHLNAMPVLLSVEDRLAQRHAATRPGRVE